MTSEKGCHTDLAQGRKPNMDGTNSWPNEVQFRTGPLGTQPASWVKLALGHTTYETPCKNFDLEALRRLTSFLGLVPSFLCGRWPRNRVPPHLV